MNLNLTRVFDKTSVELHCHWLGISDVKRVTFALKPEGLLKARLRPNSCWINS